MRTTSHNYRQGDVYLFASELPEDVKEHKNKVLAYGEVTGHRHQIYNGTVFADENGNLYLEASDKTELRHVDEAGRVADHDTIRINPGTYKVTIQEEYTPEGWKNVVD